MSRKRNRIIITDEYLEAEEAKEQREAKEAKETDRADRAERAKRIKNDPEALDGPDSIDPNTYNSASTVHNYMLNDPIIDYFKITMPQMEQRKDLNDPNIKLNSEQKFFNFITEKGNLFEQSVVSLLKSLIPEEDFIRIGNCKEDSANPDKYKETKKAILRRIPIIYQGVLHDHSAKTFGSPDFIVRGSHLKYFADEFSKGLSIDPNEYVIVDCKYNTLKLSADGFTLLNAGRSFANKGQLLIYKRMLSKETKCSRYMFVMGRGYKYTSKRIDHRSNLCNKRLGQIDSCDIALNKKVDESLVWLTDLKKNYKNWTVGSRPELYPNMCNTYDFPYHAIKKQVAKNLGELTLLWQVGPENRKCAHKAGIYSWNDKRLLKSVDVLELPDSYAKVVQKMIKINKTDSSDFLWSKEIKNNYMNWQDSKGLEFYIDFETVSNIFDDMATIPEINSQEFVFMIGLYAVCDNFTEYYSFVANSLTTEEEYRIFNDMHNVINGLKERFKNSTDGPNGPDGPDGPNFYHWGHIEESTYRKIYNKYSCDAFSTGHWQTINFCDMCKVFKQEPIVVKGAFSFSLKDIGESFRKQGLLKETWLSESDNNGLFAMVAAHDYYSLTKNESVMADIVYYNKIDCTIIYEIVNYLRTNRVI